MTDGAFIASHLSLLRTVHGGTPANPDCVVVPSNRPLSWLAGYLRRTSVLGCPIVILWTPQVPVPPVRRAVLTWAHDGPNPAVVVMLPRGFRPPWRPFLSAAVTALARPGGYDLELKRNLGLVLGTLLGCRTVMFTDDDVGDPSWSSVRKAVGVLEAAAPWPAPASVATWRTVDFPDNSVICHARREVGLDQDVFVGGGAAVVRIDDHLAFYPSVYNEDWLFLYPSLIERRVHFAGQMAQDGFDPFKDSRRARDEEFGDVLAEGLMALLHHGRCLGAAGPGYWDQAVADRHRMLDSVQALVHRVRDDTRRRRIAEAVAAARNRLLLIDGLLLDRFVRAWQEDLLRWRQDLARMPRVEPGAAPPARIEQALESLGLREHVVWASWR